MRIETCPECLGAKTIYNGASQEICPRCLGNGSIVIEEAYDYDDSTDDEIYTEPYDEEKHYKKGDEI